MSELSILEMNAMHTEKRYDNFDINGGKLVEFTLIGGVWKLTAVFQHEIERHQSQWAYAIQSGRIA